MPMSFPDLDSLRLAAQVWQFRKLAEGESEAAYRAALAAHVHPRDVIEAHETRTGRGHDQWTAADQADLMRAVRGEL